jgi:hypothetical protein
MRSVVAAITAAILSATAAAPARAAPCFPDKKSVRIDHRLWALAPDLDENYEYVGGKGAWGTCTANRGVIRDRDGSLVAMLGCGLVVKGSGLANELGIEVGMRGAQVLEAYGDGPSSMLACRSTYEPHQRRTYCWIPMDHVDQRLTTSTWGYTVWGRLPKSAVDENGIATGENALAFFRTRTVLEMTDRGSCH